MNRRDFLRTAGGATALAGAVGASGTAAAQSAKEVTVGPGGNLTYEPAEVYVKPGGTVKWSWDSDGHNVVAESVPEGADWSGTEGGDGKLYDTGHTYEHTFETKGEYSYYCTPHKTAGMIGKVIVNDAGAPASSGGGGAEEADPEHMGVPIQAHFVGLATILAIIVSTIFTFFVLKYGESPHASGGNR